MDRKKINNKRVNNDRINNCRIKDMCFIKKDKQGILDLVITICQL